MSSNLVLVLNCGSSSLKFAIIDPNNGVEYLSGLAECFNLADARIKWKIDGEKHNAALSANAAHSEALLFIAESILAKKPELASQIKGIGHRIVHGGEQFTRSVVIDDAVIKGITAAVPFAPLHNPAGLIGIQEAFKQFPHLKNNNVAVFDTAFHQTMPAEAYLYAIPYELYKEHGVRRYGAHGTSHYYVSRMAAELLKKPVEQLNVITCHLGNGGSVTAVVNGKSVETSMGLTPLEGLVMGTRSGDIDPAIIFHLHDTLGMPLDEINTLLNKKSGFLGLTGESSDCRYVEENYHRDDRAKLALDVFVHRLAKYIGSYMSLMEDHLDAIVFTGGIGENSAIVRQKTLSKLKLLGFEVDDKKNSEAQFGNQGVITTEQSRVALVIPTNEELVIAQDVMTLTQ